MKRVFATSALIIALAAGSSAMASGPDPKHDHDDKVKTKAKASPKLSDFIELPALGVGSVAPDLSIAKFVKGDSVSGFEDGQVYVVEFWATWCGPCIAAFPHLSSLQEDHGDDVKFIGVNVWERTKDQAQRIEEVESFVAKQGERMSYTVAVEEGSSMAENWMIAAGQNGIPAAFIVDGTGHVAWIGHPGGIDKPLQAVVDGKLKSNSKNAKKSVMISAGMSKFSTLMRSGKNIEDARQIAKILVSEYIGEDPAALNAVAWMLITAESKKIGIVDYKIAHKAIKQACEITEWNDWSLLDTYALAAFKVGMTDEAIKWQKKAIELTPADDARALKELKGRLAEYEG